MSGFIIGVVVTAFAVFLYKKFVLDKKAPRGVGGAGGKDGGTKNEF